MTRLALLATAALAAAAARQVLILAAITRSRRFLRQPPATSPPGAGPAFFIIVPVLREAAVLPVAVASLQHVARRSGAALVIVTTAREAAEAVRHPAPDTAAAARRLAAAGQCAHVHSPDPAGLKADQLNYAAVACAAMLPPGRTPDDAFAVIYDADSRPPPDSLDRLAAAVAGHPGASVFSQPSRFEYRPRPRPGRAGPAAWLAGTVCDAGALRANRFVLGFEIPRLAARHPAAGRLRRALGAATYAHVTGHGLCIRLSLLLRLPFPARSPVEDMHYSFILGSLGLPMIAVPSLDAAEVPATVTAQLRQAARWFAGPARALRYLRDPATRPGWRAVLMAGSALGSAAEWIGCAAVPALVLAVLAAGPARPRLRRAPRHRLRRPGRHHRGIPGRPGPARDPAGPDGRLPPGLRRAWRRWHRRGRPAPRRARRHRQDRAGPGPVTWACVAALEGPCCAGKTTLAALLAPALAGDGLAAALVRCYADHAGGGRNLPRQEAATIAEREEAVRCLLQVEAGRLAALPADLDVILADRSVHTLLANSLALQRMTGLPLLAPTRRLLRASPVPAWPDLILYLDLPQHAIPARNNGKFPPGSIYTDPAFNAAIRAYFSRLAARKSPRVAWLDATLDPTRLAHAARAEIRTAAARRRGTRGDA